MPEPDPESKPFGAPDLPRRRSIVPQPRPRPTTAKGVVLELVRRWLMRKLVRFAFWTAFVAVIVIEALIRQAGH